MIVRDKIDNKADETENKAVENARGDPYGLRGEGRALLDVTDRIRFGTTLIVPLFGSGVRNRT